MSSKKKTALITGITGQDGSYLAELLLSRGYRVFGIIRRNSLFTSSRIDHLLTDPRIKTVYGDLTDSSSLTSVLDQANPDEVYNLAAQSHVGVSFQLPEYTAAVNAVGALRLLEAVKNRNLRLYQASTSEIFGGMTDTTPLSEKSRLNPRSPYAASKLYAHHLVANYRESYGVFATNGILFNHESPRRGQTFVTKKVIAQAVLILNGREQVLELGNLDAVRDWGYAPEYVEAMWKMLQLNEPCDLVIGTGVGTSVRRLVEMVFESLGRPIGWNRENGCEFGRFKDNGKVVVKTSKRLLRPAEVDNLVADSAEARKKIEWCPQYDLTRIINTMLEHEIRLLSTRL